MTRTAPAARGQSRELMRRVGPTLALWLTPLLVALAVAKVSESKLTDFIAAGIAGLLLVWTVRHPGPALSILAVLVAVQAALFGILYALHVPHTILRGGGGLKDLLGIGILIAAVRQMRRDHRHPDALDILGLAYLGVVTAYLLLPHLFSPGSPLQWNDRLLAWRLDAGYVLLFLAVRHAPISARARLWFTRVVMAVGAVVVGFALYQYVSPHGFEHLVVDTWNQVAYEQNVLHSNPATIQSTLQYVTNTTSRVRVGSILFSPFDMADYLLIVAAVLMESMVRGARHWSRFLLLGGVVFTLFVSQVRADALAVLIVFVVCLLPAARRPSSSRWGMLLVLGIGAALVVPSLSGTRFSGGGTASTSNQGHVREFFSGVTALSQHPLGLGLGDNPVTNNRFVQPGSGNFTSDNSILQVGDEIGILAMAVWLVLAISVMVALWRRARAPDAMTAIAAVGLLAILVAGLFHHVFLNFSTSWTIWPMAGLGLSVVGRDSSNAGRSQPVGRSEALPAVVGTVARS